MEKQYQKTIYACFAGYIVQAIVNNFVPLLFLTFQESYGLPITRITFLITLNFGLQLTVDFLSAGLIDRIGYRISIIAAHVLAALGLAALAVLPELLADPFAGLLIAVVLYAVGGGLLEVLVSPIVEACPGEKKKAAMSLLHSFYCWGQVGVVLCSTLFFHFVGIEHWRVLAVIWALLPAANAFVFSKVPIARLLEEGDEGMKVGELLKNRAFWMLAVLMLCAGACELSVSQWASAFAERGLGIGKTLGDLAGPLFFALLMGGSRVLYSRVSEKVEQKRYLLFCGVLCLGSYLLIALAPWPLAGVLGCGLCGFSVGALWPGTFSMAAGTIRRGGTALFALLALAGDLGCSAGPTLVGQVAGADGAFLNRGILAAAGFPLLLVAMLAASLLWERKRQEG
ncbi:MAG: MFS transporter [Lachnospiraceae bacterium]|nr:MFS transporter [Lachnospiraceae bacterium]